MPVINYAAPSHRFMVILPGEVVPIVHIYSVTEFIAGQGGWHAHYRTLQSRRIMSYSHLRYDRSAKALTYPAADCLGRRFLVLHPAVVLGAVQCGGMGVLGRLFENPEDLARAEADVRRMLEQVDLVPV